MTFTRQKTLGSVTALAFAASLAGTAAAQDASQADQTVSDTMQTDVEIDLSGDSPFLKTDDSFVTLTGEVTDSTMSSFMLDYGDGIIEVEMDDWDTWGEAYAIVDGQTVAVTGLIDNDFLETAHIEASSVYVADLNTVFYASAADEETLRSWSTYTPMPDYGNSVTFSGIVTETMPLQGEFIIDTGYYDLEIDADTGSLGYDPLDDEGYPEISVGDWVSVTGEMDDPLFEEKELEASFITMSSS
ncbi:hypothetical protein [Henriciella marina]|uniref:hypothetical protein n=1 Tax=Henriciella marina TaxID=453851 RepID=UPI000360BFA0|nr:hypothetical protein [Henriciella marina]